MAICLVGDFALDDGHIAFVHVVGVGGDQSANQGLAQAKTSVNRQPCADGR